MRRQSATRRLAALPELLAMQEPPDAWFVGLARPAVAAWREA